MRSTTWRAKVPVSSAQIIRMQFTDFVGQPITNWGQVASIIRTTRQKAARASRLRTTFAAVTIKLWCSTVTTIRSMQPQMTKSRNTNCRETPTPLSMRMIWTSTWWTTTWSKEESWPQPNLKQPSSLLTSVVSLETQALINQVLANQWWISIISNKSKGFRISSRVMKIQTLQTQTNNRNTIIIKLVASAHQMSTMKNIELIEILGAIIRSTTTKTSNLKAKK